MAQLNPKTMMILFAALLPPFPDPAGSAVVQSLVLGAIFVAIAAFADSLYVLAAGAHGGRWIAAVVCIGPGLYAAWP